jgi:glutaredoxin
MDYIAPLENGYTIYSKSGCTYCTKAKKLLEAANPTPLLVDCDEYLIEDKPAFLKYIASLANVEYKTFPMIFKDGKFLGGFTETKTYFDKETAFGLSNGF